MKKIYYSKQLNQAAIFLILIFGLLNWLWLAILRYDHSPLYVIDTVVILNLILSMVVQKKLAIASALLIGISILVVLLGFVLIKGFLTSV